MKNLNSLKSASAGARVSNSGDKIHRIIAQQDARSSELLQKLFRNTSTAQIFDKAKSSKK